MEINKTFENGELIVALTGRLDTITAPELEASLSGLLSQAKRVVFDFAKLEYLSSAGLRIILSSQKEVTANRAEMVIKHVNETIMDVFEMTGFSSILNIER